MTGKTAKPKSVQEPPTDYNGPAIVIYQTPSGIKLDVKLEKNTLWLTQKQMAELFETERSVITKHLRNIFKSEELIKDSVCASFALTAADGKKYLTALCNLDAVISVGYRVNSKRGMSASEPNTSERTRDVCFKRQESERKDPGRRFRGEDEISD